MKIMDTDKPRFSFRWMPRSVEDVASGKYIGDTISCTDGRGTMLIFTITGRYEVELAECKGVATDGRVTIPYAIPFLFRYEENELRLSFRVVSIGESAFSKYLCSSSLKEIIIPDSVTSIREGSFERCRSLARIDIPESVTTIGGKAFKDCESLKEIIIPGSVTSIGMGAFSGCGVLEEISVDSDNPVYDSRDNCNAIIETAIGRLVQGCTATVIPESVTSIGDAAFSRCKALREIRIPVSVESIGNGAFNNCGIEKISFATTKDSVIEQDIDGYTYCSCISIPCCITSIGDSAFSGCESLKEISIPDSVTKIGDSAFSGCESLKEISIPDSVTKIGDYAFSGCESLAKIVIPASVTSIGDWAFSGCESLAKIVIPASVTTIGDWAFDGCESLKEITIPASVITVGRWAFDGCTSLKEIYCLPTTPPKVKDLDLGLGLGRGDVTVYVPRESVVLYRLAYGWEDCKIRPMPE